MITTPNMSLTRWNLLSDQFSHAQLSENFNKIDSHDHSSSKGVQISSAGIAAGTITGNNIASATIQGSNIASNSITSTNIVNGTIIGTNIASETLTSTNLVSNSFSNGGLVNAAGAITSTDASYGISNSPLSITISGGYVYVAPNNGIEQNPITGLLTKVPLTTINIPSNSSGLPRIDQVIIPNPTYQGGSVAPQYIVGTPITGANLTNRNGAVSSVTISNTYSKWMRVLDIMVPSGATSWGARNSATQVSLADRRLWARGFFGMVIGSNFTTSSEAGEYIPECSIRAETSSRNALLTSFIANVYAEGYQAEVQILQNENVTLKQGFFGNTGYTLSLDARAVYNGPLAEGSNLYSVKLRTNSSTHPVTTNKPTLIIEEVPYYTNGAS